MGRPAEIAAQKAVVDALEAALKQAQWRLDQRSVAAPDAGLVADVLALPGETLAAGAPVVSLLPPENIFVRFFVPEPELAKVHVGDTVALRLRRLPGRPDRHGLVHLAAGRIHARRSSIPSRRAASSSSSPRRGRRRIRRRCLNPGQPVTVTPVAPAAPCRQRAR